MYTPIHFLVSGKIGTVFCVGGGPDNIRAQVEEQLATFSTKEALQAGIIAHMFRLMTVEDTALIDSCCSWDERVGACVKALLDQVSHSAQYIRAVIDAAYARISVARTYHLKPYRLQSKIVLMNTISSKTSPNDLTLLQQFSAQPVDIHSLATPLDHATKDLRCVAIINRYLPEDVLKSFKDSNLCESYCIQ